VDRAALDVALELGLPCGGWCPRGRRAEDGPIPPHYPLDETPSDAYPQRTRWNIRDTDATLVLTRGELTGGTLLTVQVADRQGKPCLVVDLTRPTDLAAVRAWLSDHGVRRLNVAGPREGENPGVYRQAADLLRALLPNLKDPT
jgi:hypothetical protein